MLLVTPNVTPCFGNLAQEDLCFACCEFSYLGLMGKNSPNAELDHGKTCRGAFKDMSHLLILSSGKTET